MTLHPKPDASIVKSFQPPNCVALVSTTEEGFAPTLDPVAEAMKNADESLVLEQRVLYKRLLCKYATAFAFCTTDLTCTSLMYYRIDIGYTGPLQQPMRFVPHEHIPVLKAEVEKHYKTGAVVLLISPLISPTILV